MSNADHLTQATERLSNALKAIEEAVARRRHKELTVEALEEQMQTLETSLEAERQRGQNLAEANEQVSQRIDDLIASLKDILQRG